jgi:hypothetical protein
LTASEKQESRPSLQLAYCLRDSLSLRYLTGNALRSLVSDCEGLP